ncbi:hypothetical protein Tco_1087488 [Tanacetum coccineum]
MEESLSKFMAESAKRHDENTSLIKEIQASTDAVMRNQGALIKALEIQIRQMSKDDKMQLIKLSRESVLFPGLLKEYDCGKKEVLMKLKKLQVNSAESTTSLKRLLKEKTRIEEEIKAIINDHYSAIIKDDLPPKEKDPWSFTLPCKINDMCFDKALADLGASVSVMPYSTFTKLRKFALRIGDDKIVFKSDSLTSNIIRSELNDLNEPLKLKNHENEDLDPETEEGEIIDELMVDVVKIRFYSSREYG